MDEQRNANIENAIFLLREIEAFLSFNTHPSQKELQFMKETISEFLASFQQLPRNIQSLDEFFKQQQ